MLPCLTETDGFPLWVMIFERIGPGSAILVFTGAVLWKLMPSLVRLLGQYRRQSETMTTAIPSVLDGLKDLVGHAERIADHVTRPPQASEGGADLRLHRGAPHLGGHRGSRDISSEDGS